MVAVGLIASSVCAGAAAPAGAFATLGTRGGGLIMGGSGRPSAVSTCRYYQSGITGGIAAAPSAIPVRVATLLPVPLRIVRRMAYIRPILTEREILQYNGNTYA